MARALAISSSLEELLFEPGPSIEWTIVPIRQALLRTSAVQNFDLTFCQIEEDDNLFTLDWKRGNPWKPHLSVRWVYQWPHIMVQTTIGTRRLVMARLMLSFS